MQRSGTVFLFHLIEIGPKLTWVWDMSQSCRVYSTMQQHTGWYTACFKLWPYLIWAPATKTLYPDPLLQSLKVPNKNPWQHSGDLNVTFQKRLKCRYLLKLDDIWVVVDISHWLSPLSHNHNIIHLCLLFCWRWHHCNDRNVMKTKSEAQHMWNMCNF